MHSTRAARSGISLDHAPVFHAAERWATAVIAAVGSSRDVRTLEVWGRTAGASRGALRVWCYAAQASPRASLDFARLLRVCLLARTTRSHPLRLLDIVDARTFDRLLARGGLDRASFESAMSTPLAFIDGQRFIDQPHLLSTVKRLLSAAPRTRARDTR